MNHSANFSGAIDKAAGLASRTGGLVCTEHLLYGLAAQGGCNAQRMLASAHVGAEELLALFNLRDPVMRVAMSTRANRAISNAAAVARQAGAAQVNTEHLLFAILYDRDSVAAQVLEKRWNIDLDMMRSKLLQEINGEAERERQTRRTADLGEMIDSFIGSFFGTPQTGRSAEGGEAKTPYAPPAHPHAEEGQGGTELPEELMQFGVDLTKKAREGRLDPVIGRGKEIERIIQILCRRTKNNPVLIGEPGVGKSAIVDGLAQAIVNDQSPRCASRQDSVFAGHHLHGGGHPLSRGLRGEAEKSHRRHKARGQHHPFHRRDTHDTRHRLHQRGRDRRRQRPQTHARERGAPDDRRDHRRGIQKVFRKGRGSRTQVPAHHGGTAQRLGHHRDIAGFEGKIRTAPQGGDHGRGSLGGGDTLRSLHHGSFPPRQSHRPHR